MPRTLGAVELIQIAHSGGGAMSQIDTVEVTAGTGISGDRYPAGNGSFSGKPKPDQQLTLIEAEAIAAANSKYKLQLTPADTRRNIVTRGVALNHLVDRTFTVGSVELRGIKLCEPCGHMEKLCQIEGSMKSLIHRGGLRCHVLSNGTITTGDQVACED